MSLIFFALIERTVSDPVFESALVADRENAPVTAIAGSFQLPPISVQLGLELLSVIALGSAVIGLKTAAADLQNHEVIQHHGSCFEC